MKKLIVLLSFLFMVKLSSAQVTTAPLPEFKNMRSFLYSGNFQLPKGVTKVMVEAWGGGGGGSTVGGGGGGAYVKAIMDVTEGSKITFNIGAGGRGGVQTGNAGANTQVTYVGATNGAAFMFTVLGGKSSAYSNIASAGEGGAGASGNGADMGYSFLPGEDAQLYKDSYQQSGTTTVVTRYVGNGGNAGNTFSTAGRGSVVVNPNSTTPGYVREGTSGKVPGGGGGGGHFNGYNGGGGMVIIYY